MSAVHNSESLDSQSRMRKEFHDHLIAYLVVNAGLCALDVLTGTDKLWFHYVLGGWGLGLAVHAFRVFRRGGKSSGTGSSSTSLPTPHENRSGSLPTQHGSPTGV